MSINRAMQLAASGGVGGIELLALGHEQNNNNDWHAYLKEEDLFTLLSTPSKANTVSYGASFSSDGTYLAFVFLRLKALLLII